MINLTLSLGKKLHYKLFQAPKGYGEPVATEIFEQQYKDGFWNFLDSIDEMPNYMVTVGYVRHLASSLNHAPRLLDIGCGHGNLAQLLTDDFWKSYLGLDVSAEACRQAEKRGLRGAEFRVADFEKWEPTEKFDFILWTGSISYASDPVSVLKKYSAALTDGGVFVISLWRHGYHGVLWKNIEASFEVLNSTIVTNHKGLQWDIKVIR